MRQPTHHASTLTNTSFFKTNENDRPFFPYILASLYCIIGCATFLQLCRIHLLLRIRKWTMQKAFQSLNVVICVFRAGTLFAYEQLHDYDDEEHSGLVIFAIDFTSLLFFTTYTLLVLFWADIVNVAMRHKGMCSPLTTCVVVNLGGYVSAALFWSLCADTGTIGVGRRASAILLAVLDILAATATCYYGSSLLNLLNLSSTRSIVLTNKMREVSVVTVISTISFFWKAFVEISCTVQKKGLTYSEDAFLDVMFYAFAEILTMGSVLALLSRAPRVQPIVNPQCTFPNEGPSSVFNDPYQDNYIQTPLIPHQIPTNDF